MQSLLTHWADALLAWLGLTSALNNGWDRWVAFSLVLLAVVLFDFPVSYTHLTLPTIA